VGPPGRLGSPATGLGPVFMMGQLLVVVDVIGRLRVRVHAGRG
jgi:hypothetical protein